MKKVKLIICLWLIFTNLSAQITTSNHDIWFHYFGKFNINPKTAVSLETVARYANGLSEKQQYFLRPSFDYKISKMLTLSIGYSHYETFVYGEHPINKITTPENHVWFQGTLNNHFSKFTLTNRIRNENRWVGITKPENGSKELVINDFDYRNRLRHMILLSYKFKKGLSHLPTNIFIGNEAFINIGKNAGKTLMNQNRIIIGTGINIKPNFQLQLAYIHQDIWNFTNSIHESNPTLRMSLYSNISLKKIKKNE